MSLRRFRCIGVIKGGLVVNVVTSTEGLVVQLSVAVHGSMLGWNSIHELLSEFIYVID